MTVLRHTAGVLAATAVIGTATPATTALAAGDPSPSPSASAVLPSGLYGSSDPKFDGVWRQSLALLAQRAVGVTPAAKAVDWLAGQQCANGSFAAFRAEPTAACDAKAAVDTNSTAAAVQALKTAGGHDSAADKAVTWLKSQQNKDGGWGYTPGSPSDTNSTGVVVGALAAAGASADRSPYDLLAKWSIPCAEDGGGALAYQPDKQGKLAANADATAAGVLGALGKGFVTTAGKAPAEGYACADSGSGSGSGSDKALTREEVARNGAAYLGDAMSATGHLVSTLPGAKPQPDYGNTADAVVAMAAQGWTKPARKPYAWLEAHAVPWAQQSGPAAYAELILAAHAMGADPRDFGGTNLVTALNATGPAPRAAAAKHTEEKKSGSSVWWIVGTGLVAGIGIGFLLSGRRKQQQL
ncbi:prenyltransferase/squalene oxidase repeat-containing protein [Streptomyces hyaluromycini]|uniref:prenyltransferase/squalene oxidase repeat-containing protein n=1 Tax=Streptomyces hyaluromycini TaxID=1377993 RepID=UPI000B5CAEBE|nr:prenyltransferase/squalene oxidase repeat-containing protein [Streptomyces hyaluromycini]